jgi:GNAT superfamily N-acetyltransferase
MLGPRDVGERVVVRRIVGVRGERPLYSDALGQLVAFTATELVLDTDRGRLVVPLSDVTHAKRVPARRRATAREVAALERVASAGWPAPESEPLGAWLLRAAGGWTSRANSALAVGDPGRPLPDAIDAVVEWYRHRHLVPRITTPLPLATSVAGAVRRRGWAPQPTVLVQTGELAGIPPVADAAVDLVSDLSPELLALIGAWKSAVPAAARPLLTAGGEVRFAVRYESGAPVAIGRGVVTADWLGISLMQVMPAARRRGLARLLVRALAQWARGLGATRAYLQVEEHNTAAVALYAGFGFTTHHTYVTWRQPATSG